MEKKDYCCKQMEVALTEGHKWARQIEEDGEGDIYIWTYATDQTPYVEKRVFIDYCPFCGAELFDFVVYGMENCKECDRLKELLKRYRVKYKYLIRDDGQPKPVIRYGCRYEPLGLVWFLGYNECADFVMHKYAKRLKDNVARIDD